MTSPLTHPALSRFFRGRLPRQLLVVVFMTLLVGMGSGLYGQQEADNGTWSITEPKSVGWSKSGLERVARYAQGLQTTGLVVVVNGKKILDRSWESEPSIPGRNTSRRVDGRAVEDVASVQKSVTAFLVGMAENKGLLEIDASVTDLLGAGWSKAGETEKDITVRHLLTMTSGLTRELTREAQPGVKWRYNTRAYAVLGQILEKATGMSIEKLTGLWLTEPLGMNHTTWRSRGFGGRVISSLGLHTTAEDLARFGGLILNGGVLGERRLVSVPYFEAMLHPSQTLNPAYGYLWWLNGQRNGLRSNGRSRQGPLVSGAPKDLVAATGALGRRVYVVPSLGMVVTRIGAKTGARDFDQKLWKLLLAAAPKYATRRIEIASPN